MTKRREPLSYQLTLTRVAAAIGWDRCGAICGVSERAVRLWSDHDCETEIRMLDAERLDRAFMDHGGDHAPFHRLMALRLEIAGREAKARCLAEIAAGAAKETGEAVAALIKVSSQPGNPAMRREARKEVQEAIDTLTTSIATIGLDEKTGGTQ
ncbi:MAG TPA: hypothetical protein EYH41_00760 [Novosphingobium capsulatum]|jgi:hypothetical protein|nr:hypothetical protein [Novosphingobium capsulatum]